MRVRGLREVPGVQKAILTYLASYATPGDGLFFTKVQRGVEETGFSRAAFIDGVQFLARSGFISDTGARVGYNGLTVVWKLREDLIGSPADLVNSPAPGLNGPPPGPIPIDELKEKKKRAPAQPSLPLPASWPSWIPEEGFREYLAWRKRKGYPNEGRALQKMLRDLEARRAAGHNLEDVLDRALTAGWRSLEDYSKRDRRLGQTASDAARGAI
jgi:hypothetical protein